MFSDDAVFGTELVKVDSGVACGDDELTDLMWSSTDQYFIIDVSTSMTGRILHHRSDVSNLVPRCTRPRFMDYIKDVVSGYSEDGDRPYAMGVEHIAALRSFLQADDYTGAVAYVQTHLLFGYFAWGAYDYSQFHNSPSPKIEMVRRTLIKQVQDDPRDSYVIGRFGSHTRFSEPMDAERTQGALKSIVATDGTTDLDDMLRHLSAQVPSDSGRITHVILVTDGVASISDDWSQRYIEKNIVLDTIIIRNLSSVLNVDLEKLTIATGGTYKEVIAEDDTTVALLTATGRLALPPASLQLN